MKRWILERIRDFPVPALNILLPLLEQQGIVRPVDIAGWNEFSFRSIGFSYLVPIQKLIRVLQIEFSPGVASATVDVAPRALSVARPSSPALLAPAPAASPVRTETSLPSHYVPMKGPQRTSTPPAMPRAAAGTPQLVRSTPSSPSSPAPSAPTSTAASALASSSGRVRSSREPATRADAQADSYGVLPASGAATPSLLPDARERAHVVGVRLRCVGDTNAVDIIIPAANAASAECTVLLCARACASHRVRATDSNLPDISTASTSGSASSTSVTSPRTLHYQPLLPESAADNDARPLRYTSLAAETALSTPNNAPASPTVVAANASPSGTRVLARRPPGKPASALAGSASGVSTSPPSPSTTLHAALQGNNTPLARVNSAGADTPATATADGDARRARVSQRSHSMLILSSDSSVRSSGPFRTGSARRTPLSASSGASVTAPPVAPPSPVPAQTASTSALSAHVPINNAANSHYSVIPVSARALCVAQCVVSCSCRAADLRLL
jgi:hypothetical protein